MARLEVLRCDVGEHYVPSGTGFRPWQNEANMRGRSVCALCGYGLKAHQRGEADLPARVAHAAERRQVPLPEPHDCKGHHANIWRPPQTPGSRTLEALEPTPPLPGLPARNVPKTHRAARGQGARVCSTSVHIVLQGHQRRRCLGQKSQGLTSAQSVHLGRGLGL